MKKYGFQNFHTFKNNLTTGFSHISTAVIAVSLLNAAKSLIFRSTANFNKFEI